jgi:hypothetical protein
MTYTSFTIRRFHRFSQINPNTHGLKICANLRNLQIINGF